ncbi:MAG: PAS domain-containing protein, partial [Syntrophales bacterium]|nr:PAS domain-containing protein [Syntrophales bacterium]
INTGSGRWQDILDALLDPLAILSPEGEVLLCNRAFAILVAAEPAKIIGHKCSRLVHGTGEHISGCPLVRSRRSGQRETMELPVGEKTLFVVIDPIKDTHGKTVGFIHIVRDMTEQRRTLEALRQSEELYRTFINATPDMVFIKDEGFRHLLVNKRLADFFGAPVEEIIGKDDFALMGDTEVARRCRETDTEAITSRSIVTTEERVGENIFETIKFPVVLGENRIGVGGLIRDITARRKAEEAVERYRRRLEDIIEFLPDATFVIDGEGRVTAWNRAMERLSGVKKEHILGKGDYEYSLPFYGERRPSLADLALRWDDQIAARYTTIRREGDVLFGEAYTPALLPGNVHLSATASLLRDADGRIVGAVESIRDDTERKRLEERLNQAEKMEALGTMAGGVAHDLNNILGVMVGYAELLLETLPHDSTLKGYADQILKASLRGAAIVGDLLTLTRRGVKVAEITNLNLIVDDFLNSPEMDKIHAHHPLVRIKKDLDGELLNIEGSPVHLTKSLMNLVTNACEAITGHGVVTITTRNCYVDRPMKGYEELKEGEYVVLEVSDTGSGISPRDLTNIFEPFYTRKVMGRSGTGLGLAVVWGTVKDHGGYIDVKSSEGIGTTFTLFLPATRKERRKEPRDINIDAYRGRGEAILVVDDVEAQRSLAVAMLTRLGYQATAVGSGEEAVAYLRTNHADLVVLDMIMDPGWDGLETYRRVREIKPQQRVVLVSGYSQSDRVREAQAMGAGPFVGKPYVMARIGIAIREELDRP